MGGSAGFPLWELLGSFAFADLGAQCGHSHVLPQSEPQFCLRPASIGWGAPRQGQTQVGLAVGSQSQTVTVRWPQAQLRGPTGPPQGPAGRGCSSRLGPAAQTVDSLTLRPSPLPQTSTSASPRPVPTGPRVWTKSTATAAAARPADLACGARRVGGGCRWQGHAWAGGAWGSLAFTVPHLSCPQ